MAGIILNDGRVPQLSDSGTHASQSIDKLIDNQQLSLYTLNISDT